MSTPADSPPGGWGYAKGAAEPSDRPLTADEDELQALNNIARASRQNADRVTAKVPEEAVEAADKAAHPYHFSDGWWRSVLAAAAPALTAAARTDERERGDLTTLLDAQREWSEATFGPGDRLHGILDHLRKELAEVEANPTDVSEWIDVVILAFDGAWRSGHTSQQIVAALNAKYEKNRNREWPDWRTAPEGTAIEHVRIAREETD